MITERQLNDTVQILKKGKEKHKLQREGGIIHLTIYKNRDNAINSRLLVEIIAALKGSFKLIPKRYGLTFMCELMKAREVKIKQ